MLINGDKAACRPADLQLVDDEWVASKLSPDDFNHPKDIIDDEEVSERERERRVRETCVVIV